MENFLHSRMDPTNQPSLFLTSYIKTEILYFFTSFLQEMCRISIGLKFISTHLKLLWASMWTTKQGKLRCQGCWPMKWQHSQLTCSDRFATKIGRKFLKVIMKPIRLFFQLSLLPSMSMTRSTILCPLLISIYI